MAWFTDTLRSAIAAVNPFARGGTACLPQAFTHQLALAAYMSSGLLRKVVAIPAEDRVREWRDWQAEKDQIEAIETEERRLQLVSKVKYAEMLRGVGGGALLLITPGRHEEPLNPETIRNGGLIAINAVSRWQIQGDDWIKDLASPDYGKPAMFAMTDGTNQQKIHPSRVVCFRGDPIPAGSAVSDEEAFWGDSRLLRVFNEVQKSDNAHLWFSELVRKAKLLRIGIPNLDEMTDEVVARRVSLIAEGESTINATVFRSSNGPNDAGEAITDYQVTWNGIPAMMDAFDQRVAAVADIPFTRLMGRSPAGMNSTGQHDTDNWNRAVVSGQKLELRPCLEQIDPLLLRSAGVSPEGVTWAFAPLDTPTEKEQAETFDKTMDAVVKLQNTGSIPDEAFAKGVQNLMSEREWMPGLDQALADIPEAERYGLNQEIDQTDPSALQAANENEPVEQLRRRGAINQDQASALIADASPRSLYVSRKVINASEIAAWAREQGIPALEDDLHVTIAYSRTPVDWIKMGQDWRDQDGKGGFTITPGGPRVVEPLGDMSAVLMFASSDLSWRHMSIREQGASWDYDDYVPHISLTKEPVDLSGVQPYRGKIVLGLEIFEEIEEGR